MKTKEDCYIAAEFLPEEISGRGISFHVGDGKRYNEYFNQILSEGESYEVLLAVEWEPEVCQYGLVKFNPVFKSGIGQI